MKFHKKIKLYRFICLMLCMFMLSFTFSSYTLGADETLDGWKEEPVSYDKVVTFEDGGKDYIYLIDGVENHYFVPPKGFKPVDASDEMLLRYGFPVRPKNKDSEDYAEWLKLMSNYVGTPEPEIVVVKKRAMGAINANATNATSYNWSGYVSNLGSYSSNFYTQVQMSYMQPTIGSIKPNVINHNAYWVGLGGYNFNRLVQAGTSTRGLSTHRAWYEYLSAIGNTVTMQFLSLSVSAGDNMYVYISFQRANDLFNYYIANNTTGQSVSGTVTLAASTQFDGTTAEWVVERCTENGSYVALSNYGTATFTNCKATLNTSNTWINLNSLTGLTALKMINNSGLTLSQPGSITSNHRFNCTWHHYN